MYSTCLFCLRALGRNAAVETFQVGRRLAFDAVQGRLWVVCRACERWNLSPLETRWESIEECERLYRGTRLRVATENIGLARLADGTDLVRIGDPGRTELASWRYGDQFGRRRSKYLASTGLAVGAVAVVLTAGWSIGIPSALLGQLAIQLVARRLWGGGAGIVTRLPRQGKEDPGG